MKAVDSDRVVESRAGRVGAVLWFWIAVALLTGFLHGVELLVTLASGHLVWFSREFAWMSPIAYALVMAPAAIALAALVVFVRRPWALSFSVAVFVIALVVGFSATMATIVTVFLVVSFVLLAPSIVLGYAVKAAERDDRERGF